MHFCSLIEEKTAHLVQETCNPQDYEMDLAMQCHLFNSCKAHMIKRILIITKGSIKITAWGNPGLLALELDLSYSRDKLTLL